DQGAHHFNLRERRSSGARDYVTGPPGSQLPEQGSREPSRQASVCLNSPFTTLLQRSGKQPAGASPCPDHSCISSRQTSPAVTSSRTAASATSLMADSTASVLLSTARSCTTNSAICTTTRRQQ